MLILFTYVAARISLKRGPCDLLQIQTARAWSGCPAVHFEQTWLFVSARYSTGSVFDRVLC